MNEEEILRYIFQCVSYKHMFDLSPTITEDAKKKEDLLFGSAVRFLRDLSRKDNIFEKVFDADFKLEIDDRFEITKKGKEYLRKEKEKDYKRKTVKVIKK